MARFVIAGSTFFLGVSLLIALALREGAIPTVSASHLESEEYDGGQVFLDGRVTEIQQKMNPARFKFLCKSGGSRAIQVETREVLSDTFDVGSDLRVKGSYDKGTRNFTATYVDTKCPSKYEGNESDGSTSSSPAYGAPASPPAAE